MGLLGVDRGEIQYVSYNLGLDCSVEEGRLFDL